MARIIVPYPMQKHVNRQRSLEIAGQNLKEVFDGMLEAYPGLEASFQKSLDFLAVFVNGERIKSNPDGWSQVPLSDSDEITLILPIAGGKI